MATVTDYFILITALGAGLMAGAFFVFSVMIMKALAQLSSSEGMAAMQAINVAAISVLFMLAFLGTAATSLFVIVSALLNWQEAWAIYALLGGVFYFVGSFLVTIACNVPRNNALARVKASDPKNFPLWANYLGSWTDWNHIRTVASLAALGSFILALCV